ncbi:MAG: PAS domain S-box protein, partial [Verrucomicrobia bacterium]|nr:PAS domain S-box protein [Verrucomicrobiota bacterium]
MGHALRVLIVGDSEGDAEVLVAALTAGGYEPVSRRVATAEAMAAALVEPAWDVVLSDHVWPEFDANRALECLRQAGVDAPLLLVSDSIGEEAAVAVLKAGAADYITKPSLTRLVPAVERELREAAGRLQQRQAKAELQAARARLDFLLTHSPGHIYILRVGDQEQPSVTVAGGGLLQRLGYPAREPVTAQWWEERVHPADRDRAWAAYHDALRHGTSRVEYRVRASTGEYHWVADRKQLVRDAAGHPSEVVGVWTDITERRQAEDQLRLQSVALEAAANAILITDRAGSICWVNPAFSALTGYTPEEVLGRNPRILKSDQHDGGFYRSFWDTITRGETWHGEFVNRRKDGSLYQVEQTVAPVRADHGQIQHFIGIAKDITERKQAEARIREQARLLDLAQDAIIVRDLQDRVVYWNQGAERLYGWTAREAVERVMTELVCRDAAGFEAARQALFEHGEWSGELRQTTKSGEEVVVSARWNLVRDAQGNPRSVLVINTNITSTKKLETQFFHAQRLESLGTLASGVAHDLNNVLSPILMAAQMLDSQALDAESKKLVGTITGSAQRGADIVKQVLTFARGTEGQRLPLPPGRLVKEAVRLMRQTFPRTIAIHATVANDPW